MNYYPYMVNDPDRYYNQYNTYNNPNITDTDKEELRQHISNANREELMRHIQELTIEKVNYILYLDVYPEDQQAINAFNEFNNQLIMATEEYERLFGPITICSKYLTGTPWQWLTGPWPWENKRGM